MENITLELRPRLRSLSVYISLNKDIDESSFKVKLQENFIQLIIEDQVYNLPLDKIKLLPLSLSSLNITNHWVSFRIQTQPNALIYGTFETEVIDIKNEENTISKISRVINLPLLNTEYVFICSCCKKSITRGNFYSRILPLPSSDCEPQEWFCCQHQEALPSQGVEPKEKDLFYGINYININKNNLDKHINIKNGILHCNRCYSTLGKSEVKNNYFKLWNSCIEYQDTEKQLIMKVIDSPLIDFSLTIENEIGNIVIGDKILLEAFDGSQIHYVLLRPMELKLNRFIASTKLSGNYMETKENILQINSSVVTKFLYKCGESKKSMESDNSDYKYCEMPLSSISAGIDYLVNSTKRFPPAYRKAEDYYIGYLPM